MLKANTFKKDRMMDFFGWKVNIFGLMMDMRIIQQQLAIDSGFESVIV